MIKYISCFLFSFLFVFQCCASGDLDRVDIYLNGKLIGTWTESGLQEVRLDTSHSTDTISFHAWTNFDQGLRNATLDIRDNSGVLLSHINSWLSTNFEANFVYIIKPQNLDLGALKVLQAVITLAPEQDVQTIPIANISMTEK